MEKRIHRHERLVWCDLRRGEDPVEPVGELNERRFITISVDPFHDLERDGRRLGERCKDGVGRISLPDWIRDSAEYSLT